MNELLDPRTDIVFKLFFSKAKNKFLLIAFLEAVLKPKFAITDVEILNPQIPKDLADDKASILDLAVKLSNETRIDVEMQMAATVAFKKRLLFYWAKLHSTQLEVGQDYRLLSPTVSIAILAYKQFKNDSEAHKIFELRDRNTQELYSSDLELHFLELEKLPKWTKDSNILYDDLYRWMKFFNIKVNPEESEKSISKDPVMAKAMKALNELSADKEARELARMREKAQLNLEITVNETFAEGKAEGKAEGEKLERQKNISKMLKKGMTAKEISNLLDIPIDEIQS